MATNTPSKDGFFDGPMAIILSAVASAVTVYGLFGAVLTDLIPPFEDSQQTVQVATFGTTLVLLVLCLLIRKRLTRLGGRAAAVASLALFLCALVIFFNFRELTRTYVYRYPPSDIAQAQQTRHIRGELNERGQQFVRSKSISQAVFELGGPDQVRSMGTLWQEDSRLAVISKMERTYVALVVLLTTALFVAGIAVWRQARK
jgi:hypothetical protein